MLSVVIPTLNEAANLPAAVSFARSAAQGESIEIVVADCCSRDDTLDLGRRLGTTVVPEAGRCRAAALNQGAQAARGEYLLFLHADSLVPNGFARIILQALSNPRIVGGAFDFAFDMQAAGKPLCRGCLHLVELINRTRFRMTRGFYGDQGIFVRRSVFRHLGGFPGVSLMEDVRFSLRLRRQGLTAIVSPPILTSPRRFVTRGVVRQAMFDLLLLSCESFGYAPEYLWSAYNRWNAGPDAGRACCHIQLPCITGQEKAVPLDQVAGNVLLQKDGAV